MNETPLWLTVIIVSAGIVGLLGLILALGISGLMLLAIIEGYGYRKAARPPRFKRLPNSVNIDSQALKEIASKLRFQILDEAPYELQVAVESLFGKSEIYDLLQRKVRGGTFHICNIRREEQRRARERGSEASYPYTLVKLNTALLFSANQPVDFPPLSLSPRQPGLLFYILLRTGRQLGRFLNCFRGGWDRLNGLPDNPYIRFQRDPDFHKKVWVGAAVPEAVLPLLSRATRNVLKEQADLPVVANKRLVIVYDEVAKFRTERPPGPWKELIRSEVIRPEEWPKFAQAAARVTNALRKSEASTRNQRLSREEIETRLGKMTGSHSRPDYHSLPQFEIEQFLILPPPRSIPRSIGRASRSTILSGSPLDYAILLLPLIGVLVWVLLVIWEVGTAAGRVLGLSLGGLVVTGLVITVVTLIVRTMRRRYLLKRGILVSAQITMIKKTSDFITVGKTTWRKYRVTFCYKFRGEQFITTIGMYGQQVQLAVNSQTEHKKTRILISRKRPKRLFWIEGLARKGQADRLSPDAHRV